LDSTTLKIPAGPVSRLLDRELELDLVRRRDRRPHLGHHDPAQPLLVLDQRVTQLDQAVVAELRVPGPLRRVERPPRRRHRLVHVLDRAVGRLPHHLAGARVDHLELRAAGRVPQLPVDEHPLVAREYTSVVAYRCFSRVRHTLTLLSINTRMKLHSVVSRLGPGRRDAPCTGESPPVHTRQLR
jgi:hypothetical protein